MPVRVDSPGPVFPRAADVPPSARTAPSGDGSRWLVGGLVREWTGPTQEIRSPLCLDSGSGPQRPLLGRVPLLGEREALEALASAERAWDRGGGAWPTMPVADRIIQVESFLPRLAALRDRVVALLQWEIGKTLPDARKEFDRTVEYVRDTIEALKEIDRASSRFAVQGGFLAQIRRSPLGVVLCLGPFNYPLNETFTTLIPALLMGNTVVFKPPKHGVLIHSEILEAFAESFPPGVVNTVFGEGPVVAGSLMKSGRVDVLAFIGSARVGSILKHSHPRPNRLRCVLGLDAKNPAILLPDADLDAAVEECRLGSLSFNGQRCTAIKVVFAPRALAERFVERFSESVGSLKVGMPWEEGVSITPLPEEGKPEWLRGLVEGARAGGARVANRGGGTIDHTLFYPAVIWPASADMEVCRVEQFGPVVPVIPYDDEREAVSWVIESPWGQQASVFGKDPDRVSRVVDGLANAVSRINVNSQCQRGPDTFPFTGRKDSAEGTLSVSDALKVFSIRSLVAAKASDGNKALLKSIVVGRRSKFLSTDFIF